MHDGFHRIDDLPSQVKLANISGEIDNFIVSVMGLGWKYRGLWPSLRTIRFGGKGCCGGPHCISQWHGGQWKGWRDERWRFKRSQGRECLGRRWWLIEERAWVSLGEEDDESEFVWEWRMLEQRTKRKTKKKKNIYIYIYIIWMGEIIKYIIWF